MNSIDSKLTHQQVVNAIVFWPPAIILAAQALLLSSTLTIVAAVSLSSLLNSLFN